MALLTSRACSLWPRVASLAACRVSDLLARMQPDGDVSCRSQPADPPLGHACAVTSLTPLELALIPAGAALVGVALGIIGNASLERQRDRHTARHERDQAIAELLTATIDLVAAVQAVRAAYQQQTTWRHYIRISATILAAVGTVMTSGEKLSSEMLKDWHRLSPGLDRILAADRELDDKQRTIALDLATIVAPRPYHRLHSWWGTVAALQEKIRLDSCLRQVAERNRLLSVARAIQILVDLLQDRCADPCHQRFQF